MGRILKTAASLVTGLALAATAAVGTIPAEAAKRCDVTFKAYQPIRQGSTGAQAKAMECLLTKAGFATTVNGRFSAADARELAKFRKSIGLDPLTVGGRRAWSALLSQGTTPHLKKGEHGRAVVRLQLALRSAGFVKVPIAGRYNAATVAVIKTIQKSRHVKQTGAVNADFWKALQAGKITATTVVGKKSTSKKPVAKPASNKNATKGEKALAYAKKQLGDPYRRGGTGPNGWDCSGLTMKAWQAAGVKLPHSSGQQYRIGKKISKSDLRSGDLVFFYRGISHVGLYAGNGKVIHAPRPGKQVSYIKMSHMPYMGARRPG
ncbi:MAG TPA: NlpC/P60 family protein [Propionibacteriaceae bacterium]|nr:NlpC/P60 family protein [Propionibacteriaceae bacterium]